MAKSMWRFRRLISECGHGIVVIVNIDTNAINTATTNACNETPALKVTWITKLPTSGCNDGLVTNTHLPRAFRVLSLICLKVGMIADNSFRPNCLWFV